MTTDTDRPITTEERVDAIVALLPDDPLLAVRELTRASLYVINRAGEARAHAFGQMVMDLNRGAAHAMMLAAIDDIVCGRVRPSAVHPVGEPS